MSGKDGYSTRVRHVRTAAFWLFGSGAILSIASPFVLGYLAPGVELLRALPDIALAGLVSGAACFIGAVNLEREEIWARAVEDVARGDD